MKLQVIKKDSSQGIHKFYQWFNHFSPKNVGAVAVILLATMMFCTLPSDAQELNTVSGVLTGSNDNSLANVTVSLKGGDGNTLSTTTDANGHYSISTTPGKYSLNINNYTGSYIDNLSFITFPNNNAPNIDLTQGDVSQNLHLNTVPIHVTVKNANGDPLPNTQVTATNSAGSIRLFSGDSGEPAINFTSRPINTDANGVADISSVVGLQYGASHGGGSICASISGSNVCLPTSLTVTGETNVTLQSSLNSISGTLTNTMGVPLTNVTVSLKALNGDSSSTTTDSNGHYTMAAVPNQYSLYVNNYTGSYIDDLHFTTSPNTTTPSVDLSQGDVTRDIQLNTVPIHVKVEDAAGNSLSDVAVTATNNGGTVHLFPGDSGERAINFTTRPATTDTNGEITINSVVGLTYGTTHGGGSICANISNEEVCLSMPLNVVGATNVVLRKMIPVPATPTDLAAASPTKTPILTWNGVSGAVSYNVYRDGVKIGTSVTPTYTDSIAAEGSHHYVVTATNGGGESNFSNGITVVVDKTVPVVMVSPAGGSSLSGSVTFTVQVTDNNTLASNKNTAVWVYLYNTAGTQKQSGAKVNLSNGVGTFTVNTTLLDNGSANFAVGIVYDAAGNPSGRTDTYFRGYIITN